MKRLTVLSVCAAILLGLTGCRGGSSNGSIEAGTSNKNADAAVEVPEVLAGTWKCAEEKLEIVLEPNGTISSAVAPFGKLKMRPGETVEVNNVDIAYRGVFKAGTWNVFYAPAERELTVELPLEHYRVEINGQVLEGKSSDILTGKVSEDGKTWQADWFAFPEYYVTAGVYKNYKMPSDSNDSFVSTLIFHKTALP